MQKSKMALPKNDEKEILLIIADLAWWEKSFRITSTAIKTIKEYQVNQVIIRQTHQWKILHQT